MMTAIVAIYLYKTKLYGEGLEIFFIPTMFCDCIIILAIAI